MKYYLTRESTLKWLETPSVYHIKKDELYELDSDSFRFLQKCVSEGGCETDNGEFIDYCLKEGILTEDRILIKRPPLRKSPEPSLRYLELQITNKCNLNCKHCYIENRGLKELSINQIRDALTDFEKMQGLRVLITGGEPLLHSKFEKINKMLLKFFIRKVLFTNGILLNEKIVKKLNVDEIQISIDGLEVAHDAVRGRGTFRLAIDAVRRSLDSGLSVSISTIVHPGNIGDFKTMEKLFKDMGIEEWSVDVPCVTGRLKGNKEFQITPEEGGRYLRYGYGGGLHTSAPGFACGLHLMTVTADGLVAKCSFYSDRAVGRIEEGLGVCWQRIKPIRLDELKCDCRHIESCRGGCRYRAELSGDPFGRDPYRCALYDNIKVK